MSADHSRGWSQNVVSFPPYGRDLRYGADMELGYARVSTVKQDLDRQIDALEQTGIPRDRIYVDKKSGRSPARPRTGPDSERSWRTRVRAT